MNKKLNPRRIILRYARLDERIERYTNSSKDRLNSQVRTALKGVRLGTATTGSTTVDSFLTLMERSNNLRSVMEIAERALNVERYLDVGRGQWFHYMHDVNWTGDAELMEIICGRIVREGSALLFEKTHDDGPEFDFTVNVGGTHFVYKPRQDRKSERKEGNIRYGLPNEVLPRRVPLNLFPQMNYNLPIDSNLCNLL